MKCIDSNPKKKQVKVACTNCRHSHACCSENRPCVRCKDLGLECIAAEIGQRGRKRKSLVEKQPYLEGFVSEFGILSQCVCE
jgi:hypothetical protein